MISNFVRSVWIGVIFVSAAAAQVGSGLIVGTVLDPSGAPVPQAGVAIRSVDTGLVQDTTTNDQGRYQTPPLHAGEYQVSVQAAGFTRIVRTATVETGLRLAVDFTLVVGAAAESVNVSAASPLIESETSTLGDLRTSKAVSELPLNARNFAFLITLSAGTVPRFTQTTSLAATTKLGVSNASVNGARPTNEWNSILIDGIDVGENHNGWGIAVYPPPDAIQEFRIQTSGADAQFGRAAGGFINVSLKSGTNQFHGSLYEFHRNSAFDAKNYFAPPNDTSRFILNQFGGTIGGPVAIPGLWRPKNPKLFFFYSGQGDIRRQSLSFVNTAPTARMHNGDFSESTARIYDPLSGSGNVRTQFPGNVIPANRLDNTGVQLMALYPLPTRSGLVNNYAYGPSRLYDTYQHDFKIDWNIGSSHNINFRGSISESQIYDPGVLPAPANGGNTSGVTGNQNTPGRQFAITDHMIFGANRVNEFRFGFTRLGLTIQNPNYGRNLSEEIGIPGVNTGSPLTSGLTQFSMSGFTGLGDWGFTPAILATNNFQVEDNFYYTAGNHSLRFGARLDRRQYNAFQTSAARGIMAFTGAFSQNPAAPGGTGISLADMLLGVPANGNIQLLDGTRGFRRTEIGTYVQDDWKISSKLTLNLGVRYEVYAGYPWTEVADRQTNFDLQRLQLVQAGANGVPRSGVNSDLNNFAPRIGFAYRVRPKTVIRSSYGIYYAGPLYQISSNLAINPPYSGTYAFVNDQLNYAGARKTSQGFDRQPSLSDSALNAIDPYLRMPYVQQWNFNIQQQLPLNSVLTVAYVGTKGTKLFDLWNYNQVRPGPGAAASRRPFPAFNNISYTGFIANSSYNSLQATYDKRFSRGFSMLATYTWAHAIDTTNSAGQAHQDSLNLASDRGNSEFDVRHNFVLSYSWLFPVPKMRNSVARHLLNDWQSSGILRLATGSPFTVNSGVNTLNGSGTQRADVVAGCNPYLDDPKPEHWFNTSCFKTPAQYQFGNSARFLLFGPGTRQLDLALHKTIRFRDSETAPYLQFRAEVFNVTNTPQFNNPDGTIGVATAGVINSAGSPLSFQRTSRQIQLALKLIW